LPPLHSVFALPMRPLNCDIQLDRWPTSSADRCSAGRLAFTVIELVIVMLVMSILAAAAVPKFLDSLHFHRVESAARRLKADLGLAQHTARLTSTTQSVNFTGTTYTLSSAVKSLDHPGGSYFVDLAAPPYELNSLTANFDGGPSISFDGYGTPSSLGVVFLTNKSHQCVVELDATTGEVTITSN
jgi:prepilin-type N-terminal cleavage/methylation domain-containing protein